VSLGIIERQARGDTALGGTTLVGAPLRCHAAPMPRPSVAQPSLRAARCHAAPMPRPSVAQPSVSRRTSDATVAPLQVTLCHLLSLERTRPPVRRLDQAKGHLRQAKGHLRQAKGHLRQAKGRLRQEKGRLRQARGSLDQARWK